MLGEIEGTESGSLGTEYGASPGSTLSGKHAGMVLTGEFLVHSVQEADFAAAHAHISRRDVLVGTYATPQFKHESLAETHNLGIALSNGVEVRTALGAAHRKGGQSVLERLFETEELEHRRSDGPVETEASLVGTDRAVELHAVAEIALHLSPVVHPGHTEGEDTVGLDHPLHNLGLLELRMLIVDFFNAFEHFLHCLKILAFPRMFGLEHRHYF